jgi:hypothetical protein
MDLKERAGRRELERVYNCAGAVREGLYMYFAWYRKTHSTITHMHFANLVNSPPLLTRT